MRRLTHLFLHENPALKLPPEVLGPSFNDVLREQAERPADPAVILNYYFGIHSPERRMLREFKVILVGRGEVGGGAANKTLRSDGLTGIDMVVPVSRTTGVCDFAKFIRGTLCSG